MPEHLEKHRGWNHYRFGTNMDSLVSETDPWSLMGAHMRAIRWYHRYWWECTFAWGIASFVASVFVKAFRLL